ncbi:YgdI/YgdR family lipoprotein [Pseudomonas resinovorans]|uniref:YgdI/YgdR family lipoprotein n=1 Tax=Metapseudomonas resinovorans TaxID=53412 RepID=A0ABT4YDA4_METRE|nr:YgdI/YgdR family lipoprotein [Pseudomonas resinovorans]MDA8486874.1 YgdI/YgdR family lipoprotein [Pseudomonas resinovorans]
MTRLIFLICMIGIAGCSSEYIIVTTDGQLLTSEGKPEFDRKSGMLEFEDSEGRSQHIPQTSVRQLLER